jgi:hypothetical protein
MVIRNRNIVVCWCNRCRGVRTVHRSTMWRHHRLSGVVPPTQRPIIIAERDSSPEPEPEPEPEPDAANQPSSPSAMSSSESSGSSSGSNSSRSSSSATPSVRSSASSNTDSDEEGEEFGPARELREAIRGLVNGTWLSVGFVYHPMVELVVLVWDVLQLGIGEDKSKCSRNFSLSLFFAIRLVEVHIFGVSPESPGMILDDIAHAVAEPRLDCTPSFDGALHDVAVSVFCGLLSPTYISRGHMSDYHFPTYWALRCRASVRGYEKRALIMG